MYDFRRVFCSKSGRISNSFLFSPFDTQTCRYIGIHSRPFKCAQSVLIRLALSCRTFRVHIQSLVEWKKRKNNKKIEKINAKRR
jgi:hypothetical protein